MRVPSPPHTLARIMHLAARGAPSEPLSTTAMASLDTETPPLHQDFVPDASPALDEERNPRSITEETRDASASGSTDETTGSHPTFVHQIVAPAAKAKRPRKSAAQRKASKGGKPGNPGVFTGEDGVYLSSLLSDYVNARDVLTRGRGKNTKLEKFWSCMIAGFWKKFEWTAYVRERETKEETIERINGVSHANISTMTANSRKVQVHAELDAVAH